MGKRGKLIVLVGFFALFALSLVSATQKIILGLDESTLVNGKNISLVGIGGDRANFRVDGEVGSVQKGGSTKISGVEINVTGISTTPPIAILNVSVNFMCGDNNCEVSAGEGPTFCCRDCGCLLPKDVCISNICVQNITLPTATYQCQQDSDCNRSSNISLLCTSLVCDKSYIPHRCATSKITLCREGDACCPIGCTEEEDRDCATVDMCHTPSDCDDSNPCTQESCEGTPKRCIQQNIGACIVNGVCIPIGEWQEMRYCDASGELKLLKDKDTPCAQDYECITKNCQLRKCSTGLKRIFFFIFLASVVFAVIIAVLYVVVMTRQARQPKPKR